MSALPLAVLLLLGQLPSPQLAEPGSTLTLSADQAELSSEERLLTASGHVVLRSGGVLLRTEELEYRLDEQRASAAGGVLFVDGTLALIAKEGSFSMAGEGFSANEVELYQKESGQAPLLLAAGNPEAARRVGRNALTLRAEHVEQIARGRYLARQLRMSPCDCGGGTPDFEIVASKADVAPGDRAILTWPRIYLRGVPVLALPALYFPLASRKTGFLVPRVGYNARNGFLVDEPFFLTLGRSYDLTLTGGYRFGTTQAEEERARGDRQGMFGVHAGADFRYFPAEKTLGRLALVGIDDRNGDRTGSEPRGLRGSLSWRHASDFGGGFGARADVNLVSDTTYLADEAVFALEAPPYVRSQVWAGWKSDNLAVVASGAWYQDLTPTPGAAVTTRSLFGPNAPFALQRPAELLLVAPSTRLAGPLYGGLEVVAERYQPLGLRALDSTLSGQALALNLQPSDAFLTFLQPVVSLSRVVASPSLSLPLVSSQLLNAELYGLARAQLNSYDHVAGPQGGGGTVRGRIVGGLFAESALARVYGEGDKALRHSIEPRLELRLLSQEWGALPAAAQTFLTPVDEFDRVYPLTPSNPSVATDPQAQGIASVTSRLVGRGGEIGRLVLGQDLGFAPGAVGDTFAQLSIGRAPFTLSSNARFDAPQGQMVWLSALARLDDGKGDALAVGYQWLRDSRGTDRMRAQLDDLLRLAPPLQPGSSERLSTISFDASWKPLGFLALRYGAIYLSNLTPTPGEGAFAAFFDRILSHQAGLTLNSSCDCWRFDAFVVLIKNQGPRVHAGLEIRNIGSVLF